MGWGRCDIFFGRVSTIPRRLWTYQKSNDVVLNLLLAGLNPTSWARQLASLIPWFTFVFCTKQVNHGNFRVVPPKSPHLPWKYGHIKGSQWGKRSSKHWPTLQHLKQVDLHQRLNSWRYTPKTIAMTPLKGCHFKRKVVFQPLFFLVTCWFAARVSPTIDGEQKS